ncbi:MAG: DUF1501 domain-containing protein [Bacteroidota bacterium]
MQRRNFLKIASRSALGLPMVVNGVSVAAITASPFLNFNSESDKVLVLVQLKGGNDGLNTIIPLDQYSNLMNHRSNVMIPENKVLKLNNKTGLHPAMTGLQALYNDGRIGIVQGVGYPNQNRSHFRSTDIWTSGSAAEIVETSGWAGRYFHSQHASFPEDYPNEENPDPFALTIGKSVSTTCQGPTANFSLAIKDPFSLSPLTTPDDGELPEGYYGDQLSFLRTSINQTNKYGDVIRAAGEKGNNLAEYPGGNKLADQLKTVAQLISGGLNTKVYIVSMGGFDTHSEQVEIDNSTGVHALLLRNLSDAISAFQDDIQQLGIADRVLGMTFSEFGRRIKSNGSKGTDHGSAAPLVLFGNCVNAGILGENPEIPSEVDNKEGVAMQHDFRAIYGTVLQDWLGVSESDVSQLMYGLFPNLPLLECSPTTSTYVTDNRMEVSVFPNPFANKANISFNTEGEWMRISVFDAFGKEVRVVADQVFPRGTHQLTTSFKGMPNGNYYYRVVTNNYNYTKAVVRLK